MTSLASSTLLHNETVAIMKAKETSIKLLCKNSSDLSSTKIQDKTQLVPVDQVDERSATATTGVKTSDQRQHSPEEREDPTFDTTVSNCSDSPKDTKTIKKLSTQRLIAIFEKQQHHPKAKQAKFQESIVPTQAVTDSSNEEDTKTKTPGLEEKGNTDHATSKASCNAVDDVIVVANTVGASVDNSAKDAVDDIIVESFDTSVDITTDDTADNNTDGIVEVSASKNALVSVIDAEVVAKKDEINFASVLDDDIAMDDSLSKSADNFADDEFSAEDPTDNTANDKDECRVNVDAAEDSEIEAAIDSKAVAQDKSRMLSDEAVPTTVYEGFYNAIKSYSLDEMDFGLENTPKTASTTTLDGEKYDESVTIAIEREISREQVDDIQEDEVDHDTNTTNRKWSLFSSCTKPISSRNASKMNVTAVVPKSIYVCQCTPCKFVRLTASASQK